MLVCKEEEIVFKYYIISDPLLPCLAVGFGVRQSVLPAHGVYSTLVTKIPPNPSTVLRLAPGHIPAVLALVGHCQ